MESEVTGPIKFLKDVFKEGDGTEKAITITMLIIVFLVLVGIVTVIVYFALGYKFGASGCDTKNLILIPNGNGGFIHIWM